MNNKNEALLQVLIEDLYSKTDDEYFNELLNVGIILDDNCECGHDGLE